MNNAYHKKFPRRSIWKWHVKLPWNPWTFYHAWTGANSTSTVGANSWCWWHTFNGGSHGMEPEAATICHSGVCVWGGGGCTCRGWCTLVNICAVELLRYYLKWGAVGKSSVNYDCIPCKKKKVTRSFMLLLAGPPPSILPSGPDEPPISADSSSKQNTKRCKAGKPPTSGNTSREWGSSKTPPARACQEIDGTKASGSSTKHRWWVWYWGEITLSKVLIYLISTWFSHNANVITFIRVSISILLYQAQKRFVYCAWPNTIKVVTFISRNSPHAIIFYFQY